MADILSAVTQVVTAAVGWCGQYLSMITATGNEILLIFVILPLVGLGIGILSRLFRVS